MRNLVFFVLWRQQLRGTKIQLILFLVGQKSIATDSAVDIVFFDWSGLSLNFKNFIQVSLLRFSSSEWLIDFDGRLRRTYVYRNETILFKYTQLFNCFVDACLFLLSSQFVVLGFWLLADTKCCTIRGLTASSYYSAKVFLHFSISAKVTRFVKFCLVRNVWKACGITAVFIIERSSVD